MSDTDELRAALAAATPGPWSAEQPSYTDYSFVREKSGSRIVMVLRDSHDEEADAVYIAACSPDRIARLLDRLETAERSAELVRADERTKADARLSMIADDIIAAWPQGRGTAEMIRAGICGTLAPHVAGDVAATRADERERCAKACEQRVTGDNNREDAEAKRCAAAIRALPPSL